MKCNKGVSMITLIITIIVIIILAAIAFVGMDDAVGSAQFSRFASEFGDYATNFTGTAVSKVRESLGASRKIANESQVIYCAARVIELKDFENVLHGITIPGGYTSPRFQTDIKDATGATYVLADSNTPSYEIKDNAMSEYVGKKFYGDINGVETHWVTATGTVFTLPGFPRTVDGEDRMYISPDLYYVWGDNELIQAVDLIPIEPKKVGNDVVTGNQKTEEAADNVGEGGSSEGENGEEEEEVVVNKLSSIKVGDYVSYKADIAPSVKWRVWKVEGNEITIMPTTSVGSVTLGGTTVSNAFNSYKDAKSKIAQECKKYVDSTLGITKEDITSLSLADLEDTNVSTLNSQKLVYKGDRTVAYNSTVQYKNGQHYFAANYDGTSNRISSEFITATNANPVTLKQTGWYSNTITWKDIPSTTQKYNTLLDDTYSWLMDTSVDCYENKAGFNVHGACDISVGTFTLLYSDGKEHQAYAYGVRPLVKLSGAKLQINEITSGTGTASSPWQLEQI